MLIIRVIAGHITVKMRLKQAFLCSSRGLIHKPHITVPYCTVLALADLKVHSISVQRVPRYKIPNDGQSSCITPICQLLVVSVSRKDLNLSGGDESGDGLDGYLDFHTRVVDPGFTEWFCEVSLLSHCLLG